MNSIFILQYFFTNSKLLKISAVPCYPSLFKKWKLNTTLLHRVHCVWAQRTTEWQHQSSVQLIMVKYSKTSCSLPRPARNCSTMSLFSTWFSIDRYVFAKRRIILLSVNGLQFISQKEKNVCVCHFERLKIRYRSCLLKTFMLKLIGNITSVFSVFPM